MVSTVALFIYLALKKAKNCDSWRKKTGKIGRFIILFFSNLISSSIEKDKFMWFPLQWICHCTFFVLLVLTAYFSLWKQATFEHFKPVREQRCHYSYWWVPVLNRTISCTEHLALLLLYILFGPFLLLYRRVCYCCPGISRFGICFVLISRKIQEWSLVQWSTHTILIAWERTASPMDISADTFVSNSSLCSSHAHQYDTEDWIQVWEQKSLFCGNN